MPKKNKEGVIVLSALELDLLLALKGEELYGLELLEQVNKARKIVGMSMLGIGSLYPTLKRMEKAKLIKGEFREPVASDDSPRRKYYKLLGEGTRAIDRTKAYRSLLQKEKSSLGDTKTQPQGGFSINLKFNNA